MKKSPEKSSAKTPERKHDSRPKTAAPKVSKNADPQSVPGKELSPSQLRFLRAQAHHLNPVVRIGDAGLSAAVTKEIATALKAHELIKIKVMQDERAARDAIMETICASLDAKPVQHIGKTLVVYKRGAEPKLILPR